MNYGLILSWLSVFILGAATCRLFVSRDIDFRNLVWGIPIAVGVGIGLTSCLAAVWRVLAGPLTQTYVMVELSIAIVCGIGVILNGIPRPRIRGRAAAITLVLTAAVGIALLCCGYISVRQSLREPHGDWDAMAIWNMRARFLFRSDGDITPAFTTPELAWSHPDYPLLVPASVARMWAFDSSETRLAPISLATFFTYGSVILLAGSAAVIRSSFSGILAGALLLATSHYPMVGIYQTADIPLSFFLLATVSLLSLSDHGHKCGLPLAGLMAGFAGWTKNEGLLFIVVVTSAVLLKAKFLPSERYRDFGKPVRFLSTLLPPLLVIIAFKAGFPVPNYLLRAQSFQATFERIVDSSRYWKIARGFWVHLKEFGYITFHPFLIAVFYILAMARLPRFSRDAFVGAYSVVLMLAGYAATYLITPLDVDGQIASSLSRLLLHVWPVAVLTLALTTGSPSNED